MCVDATAILLATAYILMAFHAHFKLHLKWLDPAEGNELASSAAGPRDFAAFVESDIDSRGLPVFVLLWNRHQPATEILLRQVAQRHQGNFSVIRIFGNKFGEPIYVLSEIRGPSAPVTDQEATSPPHHAA